MGQTVGSVGKIFRGAFYILNWIYRYFAEAWAQKQLGCLGVYVMSSSLPGLCERGGLDWWFGANWPVLRAFAATRSLRGSLWMRLMFLLS